MQSVRKLYMAQYLSKWWLQNQVMRSSWGKGQINQQDNALSHEWWFTDLHLKAEHQLVTNGKQTQLLSSHMQDWPLCHLNESESNCRGDIHTLSIALIGSCMTGRVLMLQSSLQGLLPWLVFTTKITCNMPHHCTAIKMCLSIAWMILVLHPGILWWHRYQNIVRSSSRKLKSLAVSQHLIKQLEAHNKMLAIALTPGILHLFLSFHWQHICTKYMEEHNPMFV